MQALLILFIVCCSLVQGATYYFSSSGSDSNVGTSSSSPFQTVGKLNTLSLYAGDTVLFKNGETFRGPAYMLGTGSPSQPITFSNYGSGSSLPTFSGCEVLTSNTWSLYKNSIYVTTIPASRPVYNVFLNGDYLTLARTPNKGQFYYATAADYNNGKLQTNLTDPSGTWTGADIAITTYEWSPEKGQVTDYQLVSGKGVLTISGFLYPGGMKQTSAHQYFLQNKLVALDAAGEWYFDKSSSQLYLWMLDGSDPTGKNIEYSTYEYGILIEGGRSNWMVSNINFARQYSYGLRGNGGAVNITVSQCTFSQQEFDGIVHHDGVGHKIQNSTFQYMNAHGILILGGHNIQITDNTITDVHTTWGKGLGDPSNADQVGISITGTAYSHYVARNRVDNIGSVGITYYGVGHLMEYNYVSRCSVLYSDQSAFYASQEFSHHSTIRNNLIMNIFGAVYANGIYLDDLSHHQTIVNNTVISTNSYGIMMHNSHDNIIQFNTLFNNSRCQLSQEESYNTSIQRNNTIQSNILYSVHPEQKLAREFSYFADTSFGNYVNNIFCAPYSGGSVFEHVLNYGKTEGPTSYTFFSAGDTTGFLGSRSVNSKNCPWSNLPTSGVNLDSVSSALVNAALNPALLSPTTDPSKVRYDVLGKPYSFPVLVAPRSAIITYMNGTLSTPTIPPTTPATSPPTTPAPTCPPGVTGNGNGLLGLYFRGQSFNTFVASRVDPIIDFNYANQAPNIPGVPVDGFSTKWIGKVQPRFSGLYTFYTSVDDGARLYVNNQLVISDWGSHSEKETSGTIALTAGTKYAIEVHHTEGAGDAAIHLRWSHACEAKKVIPTSQLYASNLGLTGAYYSGANFQTLVRYQVDSVVSFDWGAGSPTGFAIDGFSIKWTGKVLPRFSGVYTFYTSADDGAVLKVNGTTLVNDWISHPETEHSGSINLIAGQLYSISLDYFEQAGGAAVHLLWSLDSQEPKAIIPNQQLIAN